MNSLINKYNVAGPRYTSYPTVPYWDNSTFNEKEWVDSIQTTFELTNSDLGISLYIHLPYYESLCTFCGCYKRITKNHAVEKPYILAILREWELYLSFFSERPTISEIHLGGLTPSFFSPEMLELLINGIVKRSKISTVHEFGFEGHPNNTTRNHLQSYKDEIEQLKAIVLANGFQDSLKIWQTTQKVINPNSITNDEQFILIDGHNRYKICTENNVQFAISIIKFQSLDDVIS